MAYKRKRLSEYLQEQSKHIITDLLRISLYPENKSVEQDSIKSIFNILMSIHDIKSMDGKLSSKYYFDELSKVYHGFENARYFRKTAFDKVYDITHLTKYKAKLIYFTSDYEQLMKQYKKVFKEFSKLLMSSMITREDVKKILEILK